MTRTRPPATLRTPLCDLLRIRYPVVQAGMAGKPTTPELVAAVSNAGGLGVLGAARMAPEQLRQAVRAVRALTTQPFGVNLLLAWAERGQGDVGEVQAVLDVMRERLDLPPGRREVTVPPTYLQEHALALAEVVLEERVPVFSVGLGDPGPLAARAHAAGAVVMAMVSTVEEARRVVQAGADVVVAQGAEAGGHRSTFQVGPRGEVPLVGTLALVPQVVDAVGVPVVAAGGIADGRGLAAALALGAAGVQMGTRFLMARESGVEPAYQERLAAGTETDTVVTRSLSGRPARGVRNRFVSEFEASGVEPLGYGYQAAAAQDILSGAAARGDSEHMSLLAGQGLRLLKRGQGAAEIVAEVVAEAAAVLRRLGRLAEEA